MTDAVQVADLPALTARRITFGCLNNFCKVTRETLTCWCAVLQKIAGSRLLLHSHEGSHRRDVRDLLAGKGIDPTRVVFANRLPVLDYLSLYNEIDIGLDPLTCSGGVTTCDALWMGVPVISLAGQTAAGRGTATLLHTTGLGELVAASKENYIQIAVELAENIPRLARMRSTLRQRMLTSPLLDERQFTSNLEAKYREMWRHWCKDAGHIVAES